MILEFRNFIFVIKLSILHIFTYFIFQFIKLFLDNNLMNMLGLRFNQTNIKIHNVCKIENLDQFYDFLKFKDQNCKNQ